MRKRDKARAFFSTLFGSSVNVDAVRAGRGKTNERSHLTSRLKAATQTLSSKNAQPVVDLRNERKARQAAEELERRLARMGS